MTKLNRRRFIAITAAAAGLTAAGPLVAFAKEKARLYRWQGQVMGAEASMTLVHADEKKAEALVKEAIAEINRLENVFSLYRDSSAVSRLNREGELKDAPLDLVRLLAESRQFSQQTYGAFDVTVQPLWEAAAKGGDLKEALTRVGINHVRIDGTRIAFDKPGMALTFNGIAQGYITDRVADLLRRHGLENVLVNLGETRALGGHPDGRDWVAGIANPTAPADFLQKINLRDTALATSGGYGTNVGDGNHLFDPRTGVSATRYASVSVETKRATVADALSTAISNLSLDEARQCLQRLGQAKAWIVQRDNKVVVL